MVDGTGKWEEEGEVGDREPRKGRVATFFLSFCIFFFFHFSIGSGCGRVTAFFILLNEFSLQHKHYTPPTPPPLPLSPPIVPCHPPTQPHICLPLSLLIPHQPTHPLQPSPLLLDKSGEKKEEYVQSGSCVIESFLVHTFECLFCVACDFAKKKKSRLSNFAKLSSQILHLINFYSEEK